MRLGAGQDLQHRDRERPEPGVGHRVRGDPEGGLRHGEGQPKTNQETSRQALVQQYPRWPD